MANLRSKGPIIWHEKSPHFICSQILPKKFSLKAAGSGYFFFYKKIKISNKKYKINTPIRSIIFR